MFSIGQDQLLYHELYLFVQGMTISARPETMFPLFRNNGFSVSGILTLIEM